MHAGLHRHRYHSEAEAQSDWREMEGRGDRCREAPRGRGFGWGAFTITFERYILTSCINESTSVFNVSTTPVALPYVIDLRIVSMFICPLSSRGTRMHVRQSYAISVSVAFSKSAMTVHICRRTMVFHSTGRLVLPTVSASSTLIRSGHTGASGCLPQVRLTKDGTDSVQLSLTQAPLFGSRRR